MFGLFNKKVDMSCCVDSGKLEEHSTEIDEIKKGMEQIKEDIDKMKKISEDFLLDSRKRKEIR
tara:strand:- start:1246 stop:1434 length:189 start_codon:yes stop_codon:yes gene_type:complete